MLLMGFVPPGPAGPAGAAGPAGPAGPTGPTAVGNTAFVEQAADFTQAGAPGWFQLGALTTTVAVSANSRLAVDVSISASASGANRFKHRLVLDGAPVQYRQLDSYAFAQEISLSYLSPALLAGNHTVTVEVERQATTYQCRPATQGTTEGASLRVVEVKA